MAVRRTPASALARKEVKTMKRRTERKTYSVDEAAAILGISRSLAYECVKSGELPAIKFRRRIVIPAYVIDDMTGRSVE